LQLNGLHQLEIPVIFNSIIFQANELHNHANLAESLKNSCTYPAIEKVLEREEYRDTRRLMKKYGRKILKKILEKRNSRKKSDFGKKDKFNSEKMAQSVVFNFDSKKIIRLIKIKIIIKKIAKKILMTMLIILIMNI
jgi:hypothetical protein